MASKYGFFPAANTDYSRGQEPQIARRLRRLGRALKLHLIGISGYRTPAHSVEVGGFPNDPHTRGQASDTPGVEGVSETVLRRYGLTRPFPGAQEADHIQLLGSKGGTTTARPRGRNAGPADWLKQAGWPSNLIPIMVAIGGAESGWKVDATSPQNTNGTVDYGWLQINSVHGYDVNKLTSDPVYNARAGYQIYKSQGLGAWSTYNDGSYKAHMGERPNTSGFGRTRPGGAEPEEDGVETELVSWFGGGPDLPGGRQFPNLETPLDAAKGAVKAVKSTADFFKWIAWIFHPLNILRIVEFQVGFPLIIMGIAIMAKVWTGGSGEEPMHLLSKAASVTPAGRAVRVAKGARIGKGLAKSEARRQQTNAAVKAGRLKETSKQGQKSLKREARKTRKEDIPF